MFHGGKVVDIEAGRMVRVTANRPVADDGKLYVALGTRRVSEGVLTEAGFEQVELLETTDNLHRPEGSRSYVMEDFEFGVSGLDMVLTFRNVHNFDSESRARMNSQVFKSLKRLDFLE